MSYALAFSPCVMCHQPFTYNPMRVPSIVVNDVREPLCQPCVARANVIRKENGLDLIVPLSDAYEACPAEELS